MSKQSILVAACVAAAFTAVGCATKPVGEGTHLVYRNSSGAPYMQFDYPTADFCRKTEAIATGDVRCQSSSAGAQLMARATLRFEPPGMDVVGHYADMAACTRANSSMSLGVKLASACAPK
ncbi:hypothetical protein [Caenimonas sp. SL110]|uniref:hypothetical protein n=1 Tax=Caenimonas sp. SL110 TaxID=1450524 RepID=UPI0006537A0F|nr:hypothetical protein [Caenimonas sp. SL110]